MNIDQIQTRCDQVPFFRFLGFSITDADETQITAQMPFADRFVGNPVLTAYHGGIIASFMEAIASLAVLDDMNGKIAKPINLTVDYLRPGYPETLNTRATVTKKGRRMASIETLAWLDDEEKPVAKAVFHFLLI